MSETSTPNERVWRVVCHACGFQYPPFSVGARCCDTPTHHVHNMSKPCDWCRDPGFAVLCDLIRLGAHLLWAERHWQRILEEDPGAQHTDRAAYWEAQADRFVAGNLPGATLPCRIVKIVTDA